MARLFFPVYATGLSLRCIFYGQTPRTFVAQAAHRQCERCGDVKMSVMFGAYALRCVMCWCAVIVENFRCVVAIFLTMKKR